MGGTNPYIESAEFALPTKPYTITFKVPGQGDVPVSVEPEKIPYGRTGQPGSILDVALAHDIGLDHACGGVCACSTCHVIVREGLDACNEATEDEEDQLEQARGLTIHSRLGCQAVPDGSRDLVVEVPEWNVNLVREADH
ncbi:MAG: 2Fe-2S iron-sulfur cluster binding domain-containing protein [Armatimonadetes bacterium]|nr:2Fe-2S iron-sulfur cluster binding domain-containing protein [Armatimonadota bacterium]